MYVYVFHVHICHFLSFTSVCMWFLKFCMRMYYVCDFYIFECACMCFLCFACHLFNDLTLYMYYFKIKTWFWNTNQWCPITSWLRAFNHNRERSDNIYGYLLYPRRLMFMFILFILLVSFICSHVHPCHLYKVFKYVLASYYIFRDLFMFSHCFVMQFNKFIYLLLVFYMIFRYFRYCLIRNS